MNTSSNVLIIYGCRAKKKERVATSTKAQHLDNDGKNEINRPTPIRVNVIISLDKMFQTITTRLRQKWKAASVNQFHLSERANEWMNEWMAHVFNNTCERILSQTHNMCYAFDCVLFCIRSRNHIQTSYSLDALIQWTHTTSCALYDIWVRLFAVIRSVITDRLPAEWRKKKSREWMSHLIGLFSRICHFVMTHTHVHCTRTDKPEQEHAFSLPNNNQKHPSKTYGTLFLSQPFIVLPNAVVNIFNVFTILCRFD